MKINWKYALGEIIIVIIGISVAFALNNWKEAQNNQQLKQQYFDNLALDIQNEIAHLAQNDSIINAKIGSIRQLRPYLGNPNMRRDTIVQKVFEIANSINFNPENTTYQTLINSGDLKLIDDFELRTSIQGHYSLHEETARAYKRIDNIHEKYLGDFFVYEIDFAAVRQGDLSFLDKPLLGNILSSIEGAYYFILQANRNCLESNKALLNQVEKR